MSKSSVSEFLFELRDNMDWWLTIGVIVAGALAYGYWEHTRESRRLATIFERLSQRLGGRVQRSTILILPKLLVEQDDRKLLVTAMATSGHNTPGTRGYTGPFTFVDLEQAVNTGPKIQIVRDHGIVDQVIATLSLEQCALGDDAFDKAFRLRGKNCDFAKRLLDEEIRRKLLASNLPDLDIRVEGRNISVHMNGYAQTQHEIEELIEIATLFAERLPVRKDE